MKRISDQYRFFRNDERLHRAREFADQAQQTAASGIKMRQISDQPSLFPGIVKVQHEQTNLPQFLQTRDFAKGFLSVSEDSLKNMVDQLIRIKELALQQINAPWDEESRKIVSEEIRESRQHLIALGNTKFLDQFVFSGFRNRTPPIDPQGLYLGDDGRIFLQMSESLFKPINVSGAEIFEWVPGKGDQEDLLGTVQGIIQGLRENEMMHLGTHIDALDSHTDHLLSLISELGSRFHATEQLDHLDGLKKVRLAEKRITLEGADPIDAAVDLKKGEQVLEYVLNSSSKLLNQTLINYL